MVTGRKTSKQSDLETFEPYEEMFLNQVCAIADLPSLKPMMNLKIR